MRPQAAFLAHAHHFNARLRIETGDIRDLDDWWDRRPVPLANSGRIIIRVHPLTRVVRAVQADCL